MTRSAVDAPPRSLPHDVGGWAAWFGSAEIPVLEATAAAIDELRPREDEVDARLLSQAVAQDPLMTLRVLVHVAAQPWQRRTADAETVVEALLMLGIAPFFRSFVALPTVERKLAGRPEALAGLHEVLRRAHRAASFALGFAVHRMDGDAAVIHEAALLHDFAEMLLWCHAPSAALEIRARQRADPTRRSAQVQAEVLGVELPAVQQQLMKDWRLPELLVRISDDAHAESAQVRNVLLAIRLARHTARGWHDAALPDDVAAIAEMLNLGEAPTRRLLLALDS